MNNLGLAIVGVMLVAQACFVVSLVVRTKVHTRLLRDLHTGNLDDFDARIDSRLVRQTLSPYARELLRFQSFAARGDRANMVQQFNQLMAMKLGDQVRASLLMEGFNAFVKVGDQKHARKILDAMTPELVPTERRKLCERRLKKEFGVA